MNPEEQALTLFIFDVWGLEHSRHSLRVGQTNEPMSMIHDIFLQGSLKERWVTAKSDLPGESKENDFQVKKLF